MRGISFIMFYHKLNNNNKVVIIIIGFYLSHCSFIPYLFGQTNKLMIKLFWQQKDVSSDCTLVRLQGSTRLGHDKFLGPESMDF